MNRRPTDYHTSLLYQLSYTVLIYLPVVSRKNHSCLLQPGIIVNNRSICHGRTRLNPPSVIVRHKLGWFFLTVAPTRLKVSFTSRHTRLLLYRLPLIADVPAVSRPGVSAEIPDLSRYSSLVVGAGGIEPSDLGLSVPALTTWRYSRLKPLSGPGLSWPWALLTLERRYWLV